MRRWVMLGTLALSCALHGCAGTGKDGDKDPEGGDSTAGEQCLSARDFFAQRVWTPVLDRICINCHSPEGVAAEQNAQLVLLPSVYPGFLDANYENMAFMARYAFDGKSVLLRKPVGEMSHGGGMQIAPDGDEYAALEEFVAMLEDEDLCDAAPAAPAFDDVDLLDAHRTFRKATLQLAGRLPTAAETERIESEGEAALGPLLDELLEEPAFLDRLKDIYNDRLLTDLYLRYNGAAVDLLNPADYPYVADETYDVLDAEYRNKVNRALAREPLELIAHVVRNDRPFSEILTADYTVVNPFSAALYGVAAEFDDPEDERDFREVRVTVQRESGAFQIPHAGIMTTPSVLNRMPTTPTNRNRHRARRVYELFLATDILRVATRPIDPEASSRFNNPTRDDPQCAGCHRQIDPIAGAFLKWDDRDQERYYPDREWHREMFPPGFGKEVMDTSEYPRAQQWLARRIVQDPRFVLATIHTLYQGITGRTPLGYPEDAEAENFDAARRAWEAQDATFRAIGERFVEDGMNLKTLVRELVLTPYFRAENADESIAGARELELVAVGTGRISIPEVLARKIEAVTGVRWARNRDAPDLLTSDYKILYGGIDSDSVVERLTTPNGIMANVAWRMANEVSCAAAATDFNRERGARLLFPHVDPNDAPETETGDPVPAAIERIEQNIAHLHARVLGERLPPGDPELERTYRLFEETWREGYGKVQADMLGERLAGPCQARVDPASGAELPEERRLANDALYTIRAWTAVLAYLLSDYQFLYE